MVLASLLGPARLRPRALLPAPRSPSAPGWDALLLLSPLLPPDAPRSLLPACQIAGVNLDEMLRGALGRNVDFTAEPLVDYEEPSSGYRVHVWQE